jgi:hypothetical protein
MAFSAKQKVRIVNDARHLTPYPIIIPGIIAWSGNTKWNVGVHQYPVFAEYAEGMVGNGSSGISDTGLTMRAFLPIDSQGNRSSIHVYNGPATVVDSRVVCVRPNITNLGTHLAPFEPDRPFPAPILHGNISIPLDLLQEASASSLSPPSSDKFNCSISFGISSNYEDSKYHPSDWDLSICQFEQRDNPLKNVRMALDEPLEGNSRFTVTPRSYLLVNFSSRVKFEYTAYPKVDFSMIQEIFDDSTPGLFRRTRNEWTDVYRTNNNFTAADATLSFSLCFPASATRYMNVSTSSRVPLVQPRYSYHSASGQIRFDDVRKQMLSSPHTTMEQRGLLSLQPQLWRENDQEPPYLSTGDAEEALKIIPFERASTINLLQWYNPTTSRADISIGGLLLEILREGGTTAEAVQSMMTALLASRYQDYVFLYSGNITNSTRADFVAVQIPGGQGRPAFLTAGPTGPYILVMAVIAVHSLVIIFVVVWFCRGTCFWRYFLTQLILSTATNATLLWESWSNISQVISSRTTPYLERAAQATDSEVKSWIKDDGLDDLSIAVVAYPRAGQTDLASVRKRAQRVVAEQSGAEQGLMMDELRPTQSSTIGTEHSTAVTRAPSASSDVSLAIARRRSSLEA